MTKKTKSKVSAKRSTTKNAPVAVAKTKRDHVLALLRRDEGATLDELMTATGWQPHSVRGFISGTVRKRLGLTVTGTREADNALVYRVTS